MIAPPATELRSAIERAYSAFAPYALKPGFADRCSPLGDRPQLAARLQAGELRSLPADDLAIYSFKARHTMGDRDDFKYFVPRLLEVFALDPGWVDAGEVTIFEGIRDLGWAEWPAPDRRAVADYLAALWQEMTQSYPTPRTFEEFHLAVAALGLDVGHFVADWRPPWPAAGLCRAAEVVRFYTAHLAELEDVPQVSAWFTSNRVGDELEQAYFRYQGESFAGDLAAAADELRSFGW